MNIKELKERLARLERARVKINIMILQSINELKKIKY